MGVIHQLDQHVAELIAAGEVVERPASVVKELVENAIDAGATVITVEIQNGGMTYLRVSDNGTGIYRDDVHRAFLNHATSKIHREEDLNGILTMGFRGEALPSIAAVSRVELLTRREDEIEGTRYVIEGSYEKACEAAGCSKGTTIVVRDLFYNTPARLKFVKKDVSEANAVAGVLDKIAISYPGISIKFMRDGLLKLNTPGDGSLESAVYAVFGRDFSKGLTSVHYKTADLSIDGLISRPEHTRANRTMQNFFVNRRFVKSRTCAAALEEAYKGAIMVGKFPACILNLTIEPHTVDVNVHPAKIEVRFANERPVFDVVYYGVKSALLALKAPEATTFLRRSPPVAEKAPQPREQLRLSAQQYRDLTLEKEFSANIPLVSQPKTDRIEPGVQALKDNTPAIFDYQISPRVNLNIEYDEMSDVLPAKPCRKSGAALTNEANVNAPARAKRIPPGVVSMEKTASVPQQQAMEAPNPYQHARMVGELFSTYIILENKEQLLLIDKHAAHERILFNRIKEEQGEQFRQALLEPQTVLLEKEEYAAALEHLDILTRCGFEAEDFGSGSLMIRTAPMWFGGGDVTPVVNELCANLKNLKHDITPEMLESLYHSVACRSAVKGGNQNEALELSALVRLLAKGDFQHCPHGRPVCVTISRRELEKQFGRV